MRAPSQARVVAVLAVGSQCRRASVHAGFCDASENCDLFSQSEKKMRAKYPYGYVAMPRPDPARLQKSSQFSQFSQWVALSGCRHWIFSASNTLRAHCENCDARSNTGEAACRRISAQ